MRVLVAGGAGYIGSITAWLLLQHGHEVVVMDNLTRGHQAAISEGCEFVFADLSDEQTLRKTFRKHRIEAVMHFAAHSQVGESMIYPELYFENNVVVGKKILDCMLLEHVTYMIFSSTCAIFGQPEQIPIHEDLPKNPTSVYGETKLMFERILHWYNKIHGIRFTSLRYFNAAGAYGGLGEDHYPETHLIPLVLDVALGKKENIQIFGDDYATPDGTCIRDYIHIYDLANAHILALENSEKGSAYFNLGNGDGYSVKEVIQTAREVTGHPIPAQIAQRRPGDPARLIGGSEKIQSALGWKPKYPKLQQIIESAWQWHRAFPNGYPKEKTVC